MPGLLSEYKIGVVQDRSKPLLTGQGFRVEVHAVCRTEIIHLVLQRIARRKENPLTSAILIRSAEHVQCQAIGVES